jgi:hypothetical protein
VAAGYTELRALLARMRESHQATATQLGLLARQIAQEAEAQAVRASGHPRQSLLSRGNTLWRKKDEAEYQYRLAGVMAARQPEVDALARRERRQAEAIDAFLRKHRFNDPDE